MGDGLYRRNKVLPLIRKDAGSLCEVVCKGYMARTPQGEREFAAEATLAAEPLFTKLKIARSQSAPISRTQIFNLY